jgi:hypothetical protein
MKMKAIGLSAILLLSAFSLFAQQDRGTFVGTVTDASGAVVPNAKVAITNVDTNVTVNTVTNDAGNFRTPNLQSGTYRVKVEVAGFKTAVREGVRLAVQDVARVDVTLEVGQTSESVTVTGEAPLLTTDTPEVGTLMTNKTVVDLPLGFSGGRYAENFAYKLTPGVGGNNWESRINGAPSFSKEVVLDGASASIYISGHMGESSPSMEALEEFKVQTSGMSAEFSRTAGGVFNFVMKSGTNQLHGSAMGQIHNEWADANTFARNFYCGQGQASQCSPRRDRRDNYAFSLGGPIIIPKVLNGRDKWFWYAAYEKYNESFAGGGSPTVTVPLPEWYDGNLSNYLTNQQLGVDGAGNPVYRGAIYDPKSSRTVGGKLVRDMFPNNMIPQARISTVAKNLAAIMKKHYMPQVKGPDGQYQLLNNAFFPVSNQAGFNQKQFSTKSDYQINSNQRLSGSFVWVDRPRTLLDQGGVWDFNDPNGGPLSRARLQWVSSHYIRMAHDWTVSPTMLNHMVGAFNRQLNPSTSKHVNEPGAQILGIKGIVQTSNYPQIGGLTGDRVGFPTLGYQANDVLAGTAYQFTDTLTWLRGNHSLKFGFDWRWNGLNARNNAGPGQFNFAADITGAQGFNQTGHGFASMLLGEFSSASVVVDVPVGSQFPMYSWFVQDDWKVNRKLMVNIGMRWDFQQQGTEKYDRLHNFNPSIIDPNFKMPGAVEFAGQGEGRNGKRMFYSNSLNSTWGPRAGFAYQVMEKTTLRGGYGLYYSPRIPNGWSGVPWGNKAGFTATNTQNPSAPQTPAGNWDNGYNGTIIRAKLDPSLAYNIWGPVSWDPDGGRVGYTQQWNFNIQRELPGQMVFDLGYIGTKSSALQANELRKMNQIPTAALALGDTLGVWINNDASIPAAAKALGARYPYADKGEWIPTWQTLTPYPTVIYWSDLYSWNSPLGFSNYQALQIQLNKRYSHGVQWLANYTWSKTLDNLSSVFGDTWGMNAGRPLDYYNMALEKSVSDFDRTHYVKIGASYDVPVGRKKQFGSDMHKALDFLVGGWTLQYIGNYSSGQPIGFGATGTPNANFATNRAIIDNPNGLSLKNSGFDQSNFDMSNLSTGGYTAHRYINTSLVKDPPRYVRGNASRRHSGLRDFAYYSDDASLQKNFYPIERVRVQFRAEFLNMFNRHRFSGINTNPASPLFGQITGVSDDRRQIQFGIRADF